MPIIHSVHKAAGMLQENRADVIFGPLRLEVYQIFRTGLYFS